MYRCSGVCKKNKKQTHSVSIAPGLTSQEAMHIQTVRVKYSPACHTQGAGAAGLRPTMQRQREILYSKHTLLLASVFTLKSSVKPTHRKHTHSHTSSPAQKGQHISIPIRTGIRLFSPIEQPIKYIQDGT